MTDPITPPPELVQQWLKERTLLESQPLAHTYLAARAAQWGADQELEACLANIHTMYGKDKADWLRAMRRPKPPSLTRRPTMTEPLSPAAQKNESREFLAEWFEYDTNSPSCLKWKKRPPHGRKGAGDFCSYLSKYYRVRLMGHWYQCHRIILILHNINPCAGQVADHINRNKLDNHLENLRWLNPSQNHRNTASRATSGWKHARLTKENTYRANYRYPGEHRTVFCGTYKTAEQAHYAAIAHKLENYWRP